MKLLILLISAPYMRAVHAIEEHIAREKYAHERAMIRAELGYDK